ncbi:MAG TPA: acyl-CoA dehydrogenase [Acidimicrobiia bacterium]|nr:acyl-CoA dehydrogenase [Acidimicrobiia bacterium]
MDVRLSPEQQTLRDAAARLVDRLGPRTVEDLNDLERVEKLDAAVASTGWRELRAAADGGGPWASAVEAAIVTEEMARAVADAAFIGPTLAAELRRLAGAPPAARPETVVLDARLERPPERLTTESSRAVDARGCSSALAPVPVDGGYRLAQVEVARNETTVDLTRPTATTGTAPSFEAVGATHALTPEDLTRWFAFGLALTSADLVGVMRGAVGLATQYATARRQFDVPVGSFQAVQHLLANALVATEGARSLALQAAWSVDALDADGAFAACATAKAYCSRAALLACENGIQVHGGIGNTWDCLAHVYLRRALLSIDMFGGVGPNLDRVLASHGVGNGHGLR